MAAAIAAKISALATRIAVVVAGLTASAVLVTACGGGSNLVVRPPNHSNGAAGPSSSIAISVSPSSSAARHPAVLITPSTGLQDGQSVRVAATGFAPGESLQVVQCAAKGTATGAGDCNIGAMLGASADAQGRLTVSVTVRRGPFGGNKVVCGAGQPCLISVTQASLSPTDEADAPISFATGS